MGIIIKQTIKGSIWSYLGVIIGFVTTTYLYTTYLSPEIIGLFGLLVAVSTITSNFASLGMNGVAARLFPFFRSPEKGHNGFLFLSLTVQTIGFLIFLIFYFLYDHKIVENNIEKSAMFSEYVYLIVPLTLFSMFFSFFDTYNKLLYNTVLGTFLQEFLQRFFILISVVLFALNLLTLEQLVVAYAIAISLKGVIILIYLYFKGELNLKPSLSFIDKDLKKEITSVAMYSIIGGLGSMVVFNIDKIVINQMLDLSNTGVYTIAFYFGTLVIIPSRPLLKIAGTLIADAFAKDDIKQVQEIYYKSCINQFIIGGFLFLGIWANIDNVLNILGDDYLQSKWVIFFIGIGYLFDMMTGANGLVINYSKYYKVSLIFIVVLVVLVVILLYLLIPVWGITGAAIAIAVALFLNNLMRHYFLLWKYKMQPFSIKFLWMGLFFIGLYFILELIPQQPLIIDLLIRGSIIAFLTIIFLVVFPVSEDVFLMKRKIFRKKVF